MENENNKNKNIGVSNLNIEEFSNEHGKHKIVKPYKKIKDMDFEPEIKMQTKREIDIVRNFRFFRIME